MILKDPLQKYIPLQWAILHPNMYSIALTAVAMKLAEVNVVYDGTDFYWRRLVDDKEMELGL